VFLPRRPSDNTAPAISVRARASSNPRTAFHGPSLKPRIANVRVGAQVSGNGFFRTMLRPPLHSSPACRHSLDFAHVAMVYGGHLTIVLGNRDRVPTYFGDTAAIIGIASP
jgi:hypothetical protein